LLSTRTYACGIWVEAARTKSTEALKNWQPASMRQPIKLCQLADQQPSALPHQPNPRVECTTFKALASLHMLQHPPRVMSTCAHLWVHLVLNLRDGAVRKVGVEVVCPRHSCMAQGWGQWAFLGPLSCVQACRGSCMLGAHLCPDMQGFVHAWCSPMSRPAGVRACLAKHWERSKWICGVELQFCLTLAALITKPSSPRAHAQQLKGAQAALTCSP